MSSLALRTAPGPHMLRKKHGNQNEAERADPNHNKTDLEPGNDCGQLSVFLPGLHTGRT